MFPETALMIIEAAVMGALGSNGRETRTLTREIEGDNLRRLLVVEVTAYPGSDLEIAINIDRSVIQEVMKGLGMLEACEMLGGRV